MNVMPTCFAKDCDKSRFREYYVCAEHFVFYAAQRYTESMVTKVKPPAYFEFWCIYHEATACTSSEPEHTTRGSAERQTTSEERTT
jgi:hypothetical protein